MPAIQKDPTKPSVYTARQLGPEVIWTVEGTFEQKQIVKQAEAHCAIWSRAATTESTERDVGDDVFIFLML